MIGKPGSSSSRPHPNAPTPLAIPPPPGASDARGASPFGRADAVPPSKRRKTKADLLAEAQTRDTATLAKMQPKPKAPRKARPTKSGKGKSVDEVEPVASSSRGSRVRTAATKAIMDRLRRVKSQRMFLIDRRPHGTPEDPIEMFKVLGSTANVYSVVIGPLPRCDCPDCLMGNIPCKHIIFVFLKVLKVSESSTYWYQKSLLPEEVREVFSQAPPMPHASVTVSAHVRAEYLRSTGLGGAEVDSIIEEEQKTVESTGAKRIEPVGEDCPVCYEEMTADDESKGKLVYDQAMTGCGKALHKECFKMWKETVDRKGDVVTCVWCRAPWPSPPQVTKTGSQKSTTRTSAYMNMADVAGMSRVRDTSSYYWGPMRGRRMWEPRYEDEGFN